MALVSQPDDAGLAATDRAFCAAILPDVSRTFALGIRLLPPELARPVSVSYLVCRIADTIEDNPQLAVAARRELLAELELTLADPARGLDRVAAIAWPATESRLMQSSDRVFRELARLSEAEQAVIARWVGEMVRGMSASVRAGDAALEYFLDDMAALHRYCYFVAGTVGHLLTDLFRLRCRGVDPDRYARLEELAPHFGLGLQLTNVTRDMADDIPAGRNFVPRELWQQSGLEPAALFRPGHETESWRVGAALSADASKYLRDALAYCCELPRTAFRVRFFCYTSLIFAARTLALIDKERDRFVRGQRIKMPRREVRLLLAATFICVPSNTMLRLLFHRIARDRGNG